MPIMTESISLTFPRRILFAKYIEYEAEYSREWQEPQVVSSDEMSGHAMKIDRKKLRKVFISVSRFFFNMSLFFSEKSHILSRKE